MDMLPPASALPMLGAKSARRSNWGPRLVALLLSALAFLGLWQGAQHATPTAQETGGYTPPSGASGVLLPPGGLGTHGSTRLS